MLKIIKPSVFIFPAVLSLCILYICYPGFMSYDSIQMLEEARSSVKGGIFPATPVYILRFFDITGYGPTLMILTQNFILLLSAALILVMLGAGLIATAASLLGLVAIPTVIGCMLVLWKDVTLTALIMLSFALIFWSSQTPKEAKFYQAAKWSSLLLFMVGTLVKFNAITATVIIALYWVSVFYGNQRKTVSGMAFILIVISMVISNKLINEYRFPSFQKLEPNGILYGIMANDLLGISGWSRVSLIPFDPIGSKPSPKIPITDIDNIYSPLGSAVMYNNNIQLGSHVNIYPEKFNNKDVVHAWLQAVFNYPTAYINYRLDLFSEIIGATKHGTYEPTHFSRIDENKFGITFQDRDITEVTLKYIKSASNTFLGKPWLVFLLSFLSVLLIIKNSHIRPEYRMLAYYAFAAACLYIIPFLVITLSGEVRYSFTSTVLGSIPIFVRFFAHDETIVVQINKLRAGFVSS